MLPTMRALARRAKSLRAAWLMPTPALSHRAISLPRYPLGDTVRSVRAAYERVYGGDGSRPGVFTDADWQRVSFSFDQLEKGGSILDVGPNRGQFPNMLLESERFERVAAVDLKKNKNFLYLKEGLEYEAMDVTSLTFEDNAFDVVTCFEVLEHLPAEAMARALRELRRVCRSQLLMSVPYAEPQPIYKGHQQRFLDADFGRLFPQARFAWLKHAGKPWMLMEERQSAS